MFVFLRFFFLCIVLLANLAAEDYYEEDELTLANEPQFVSLGSTCHMAIALKANGFRKAAFPFDWLISNHEPLINIIEDDFFFFTNENCFSKHNGIPACNNNYYKIGFPHDFDLTNLEGDKGLAQWNAFKEKYDRRITRFRELKDYKGKVFFVRACWSQLAEGKNGEFNENAKRAQELRWALERYFPSLDFTLIVISYNDLNIPEIPDIKGIIELKIGRSYQDLKDSILEILSHLSESENN